MQFGFQSVSYNQLMALFLWKDARNTFLGNKALGLMAGGRLLSLLAPYTLVAMVAEPAMGRQKLPRCEKL